MFATISVANAQGVGQAGRKDAPAQTSNTELIQQGKSHYRAGRFKQALARFEAALKIEPNNDEALGLAAITAFRLDEQEQARAWFMRRADLPGQKPSVKAFSYYRIALTYWRQAHDEIAKSSAIAKEKVTYNLPSDRSGAVREMIRAGLDYANRALSINGYYSEAHNVINLLQTEAAFCASDRSEAQSLRRQAAEALRRAIKYQREAPAGADGETANFNLPTVRIGEIPRTDEEEKIFQDEMLAFVEGGRVSKRVDPVFPSMRSSRSRTADGDPSKTGLTDKGGAYSVGSGRGALTAAYAPGTVKVEILVSTKGDVVFAHVVDGRDDLNGAAILAARAWKFTPAKVDGVPVQMSGMITFDMRPGGSRSARTTPKQ